MQFFPQENFNLSALDNIYESEQQILFSGGTF